MACTVPPHSVRTSGTTMRAVAPLTGVDLPKSAMWEPTKSISPGEGPSWSKGAPWGLKGSSSPSETRKQGGLEPEGPEGPEGPVGVSPEQCTLEGPPYSHWVTFLEQAGGWGACKLSPLSSF